MLVSPFGVHIEIEVAAVYHRPCGVAVGEHVEGDVHRPVSLERVENRHVARSSLQHIRVAHVGCHVEMAAQRCNERLLCHTEGIEVDAADVGGYGGVDFLRTYESVHREQSVEQLVLAVYVGVYESVAESGVSGDAREVVFVVDEFPDVGTGIHRHALLHRVGAPAVYVEGSREVFHSERRHEMVYPHSGGRDFCAVCHVRHAEPCFRLHRSPTLAHRHVGEIHLVAAGLHVARERDAVRYPRSAHVLLAHERRDKLRVGSRCLEVDAGAEPLGVGEIGEISVGVCFQCRRQVEVEQPEPHPLEVSAEYRVDSQWFVGPLPAE